MPTNSAAALPPPDDEIPSLGAVFEVQDDLLVICNDLDRLVALLSGACAEMSRGFHETSALIARRRAERGAEDEVFLGQMEQRLSAVVTALQFEDMATQLIAHTRQLLRSGADRLAVDMFGDEDGAGLVEAAPRRPNPVTQNEMDAGSVELF